MRDRGCSGPEFVEGVLHVLRVSSTLHRSAHTVRYLANEYGVAINTAFFTVFEEGHQQYLTADWLMDQEEVVERAERRRAAPWTGYYYVNAGHDPGVRSWDDMRRFGFIAAGHGRKYSEQLERLSAGDPVYVYQKGHGYIGFGVVTAAPAMAQNFLDTNGHPLDPAGMVDQGILHDADDVEIAEYLVSVKWHKALPLDHALKFTGVFANQNVVCRLTHPATLEFLAEKLGTAP